MKTSLQYLLPLLAAALLWLVPQASATADEAARLEVILVQAGTGPGGVDRALQPYAATLQRLFRFDQYRQVKRQTARMEVPGKARVGLAEGQTLQVETLPGLGSGLRADIEWKRGGQQLLHTRIQLKPGSPTVLGGPRSGEGTWLLILELR